MCRFDVQTCFVLKTKHNGLVTKNYQRTLRCCTPKARRLTTGPVAKNDQFHSQYPQPGCVPIAAHEVLRCRFNQFRLSKPLKHSWRKTMRFKSIKKGRVTVAAFSALALAGLAACGSSGNGGGGDDDIGTINFSSPETADMTEEIARAFEDQVGGEVNVTYGGTGDIVNRIQAEKNNPQGDVWYGGGGWIPFEYAKAEGFLEPYTPETAEDWEMFEGPLDRKSVG